MHKGGWLLLEAAQILLPLAAILCFAWGAWQCAARTLFPAEGSLWQGRTLPEALWRPALACLLAGAAVQGLFVAWCLSRSGYTSLGQALEAQFYGNTDAKHYLDLAQYGYGSGEAFPEQYLMIVFFPLFPWLLRLLNLFGWFDYRVLALVVQLPLFCAAGTGLFALAARQYDRRTAWLALVLLLVSPASVFFFAPMTESLFLALTVWYVWCLQTGRWGRAALLGVLAGLARAPGGLLTGLALLYLLRRARLRRCGPPAAALPAMLGPAAGLGLYFALNQAVYGRWDQYSVYQWEHWGQKLGLFTDTIRYHLQYMARWWQSDRAMAVWVCLAAVLCIVLAFGLLAAAARTLPPHWLGYGLAYLLLTMGATWLLSAPRYAVALFCLPVELAALLRGRRGLTAAVVAALLLANAAYTAAWLTGAPVY